MHEPPLQMASMVARKKEELASKLERLQEKKAGLTKELEKLTATEGGGLSIVSADPARC